MPRSTQAGFLGSYWEGQEIHHAKQQTALAQGSQRVKIASREWSFLRRKQEKIEKIQTFQVQKSSKTIFDYSMNFHVEFLTVRTTSPHLGEEKNAP